MSKPHSSQRRHNDSVYFVKSAERPLTRPSELARSASESVRTTSAISGRFRSKDTTDTVAAKQAQARFVAALQQHRSGR